MTTQLNPSDVHERDLREKRIRVLGLMLQSKLNSLTPFASVNIATHTGVPDIGGELTLEFSPNSDNEPSLLKLSIIPRNKNVALTLFFDYAPGGVSGDWSYNRIFQVSRPYPLSKNIDELTKDDVNFLISNMSQLILAIDERHQRLSLVIKPH